MDLFFEAKQYLTVVKSGWFAAWFMFSLQDQKEVKLLKITKTWSSHCLENVCCAVVSMVWQFVSIDSRDIAKSGNYALVQLKE